MKLSLWYTINTSIQNALFKVAPWTVIFYAKREYGYSLRSLAKIWKVSRAEDSSIFGKFPRTRTLDFFSRVADRAHKDSDIYQCIYGTCTIIWHPKRGNTGGMGPAGCPCDDMSEPRDLITGVLRKGL